MHSGQRKKLKYQMSHPQQQAKSRKSKRDIGQDCTFTKSIPETRFPQQSCTPIPPQYPLLENEFSDTGTCGVITFPNHYTIQEDGDITNIVIPLSHKKAL